MTVRVNLNNDKSLKNVEALKQSKIDGGQNVIKKLPQEIVEKNTYDVNRASGVSANQ